MPAAPLPRRADAAWPTSDPHFAHLLDVIPAAAYTCDAAGLITGFNRPAAQVWGREPRLNDPADRYCGSFRLFATDGSPIAHDRCWMARALLENVGYNEQEIVVERPDGTRRTALAHANPFRDAAGGVVGAVNVLVDITDRKRAEEEVREADRRKTEFLATLSHELRNPLAPLRNGVQILRLVCREPAAAPPLAMMDRQLTHMVRLIDDLLDLSRISRGKVELRPGRIDLRDAVRDAVEAARPLADGRGHELAVDLPARPVYVDGDRTRLAQVFANLLTNAARYTPRGGHVRLTAEQQGSDAVVAVADDGAGIPAGQLAAVFEMFTQVDREAERAEGGLGVGLALVKGLVELHGGRVEARSDGPGRGSVFTVRLPAAVAPVVVGPAADGAAPARARRYRILVVDDNRDAADSTAALLGVLGHDTRTAHDGLAAVAAAAAYRPEVVVLDLGLPGISGYDAARRIRDLPGGDGVVLIAQTGWCQDDDRDRSREAGFNFHLVKPVDPAALENLLAGLLLTPTY